MDFLSNEDYDRISKCSKNCLGYVRDLNDKYSKLAKDHAEFKKLVHDSGLSNLSELVALEQKQYRCIKYTKELDNIFIRGPTSALVESGKSNFHDNKVAEITASTVEPNTSRAQAGIVSCLNEAICANLSASSDAILVSNDAFRQELGEKCKNDLTSVDKLIAKINEINIDF